MGITRSGTLLAALAILAAAFAAGAQTVKEKKSLTLDGARQVIAAAKAYAKKAGAPGGVIAVVDDGGSLVALERLDGTFAAGANVSIGKARTAVMFKRPTKFFEDVIRGGRTAMVALDGFTPLQGGVPISVDGEIVGGVGVSGASSAQQDEELALAGAAALEQPQEGAKQPAPIRFFDARTVADAFGKGAVLLGEEADAGYMIHASRREKPGQAEIHALDADIIYVLGGNATFVTGGRAVDPKTTAPNEIRGTSIEGGETRELAKGDVIVVPAGTPHWFSRVDGTFTYYVVKVRR